MSRITTACCGLSRLSRGPLAQPLYRHIVPKSQSSSTLGTFSFATQAPIPNSTAAQKAPVGATKAGSDAEKIKYTPKIEELVQTISQLSLLEAAELVDALKSRLKITEVAMPVQAASSSGPSSDAGGAKEKKSEPEKPKEKTVFSLTLTQIDATQKAKVIKEVKTIMPNMNLVEAKKFVESLPKQLKENGTKDEIEKLKKALESVGATVKVE
ncbi:hypothetical protein PTTG_03522 [Puccinia triticina 1-1 BBBD Race 1]|uniref:Ribosomal protein L7/L12 C-terminal domain-containing protein n=1 Tax=Puccinia triticina (isolate 1-1 / race 1 (BBBD)) TaxID=630390 RepID=A0A0C4ERV2_PUCT1|nr:hypothetical protein PTTG_03522 [Puccinia triticina 1-1 BBBD Race 1]